MKPIILNEYGEYVLPLNDTEEKLSFGCATHGVCGGFADLSQVSKTHQAFHCRICNFRFVFPIQIGTWRELRQYAEKIAHSWS